MGLQHEIPRRASQGPHADRDEDTAATVVTVLAGVADGMLARGCQAADLK